MEEVTKSRYINEHTRMMLWGRSGGRCQFKGCNKPVWKNPVTQKELNIAQKAHIYAFSDDGPRGRDGIDNSELNSFENLMLVCHPCHTEIDDEKDGGDYPVELLQKWKTDHETRVEIVTGIDPDHHGHVILYGKSIGKVDSPLRFDRAAKAMFPTRYPAEHRAIELSMKGSERRDNEDKFWSSEQAEIERKFDRLIRDRMADGEIEHLSVFGLAPMPLLIRLGTLLTDIPHVDVYQLHRDPKGWSWPDDKKHQEFTVQKPVKYDGPPALIFSLSDTITEDRIHEVLPDASIWTLTIENPNQECVRSRDSLTAFASAVRPLIGEIKSVHGQNAPLHIFPAAPVSTMIELGRLRQPKAAQPWIIYDQNNNRGGFTRTLTIQSKEDL